MRYATSTLSLCLVLFVAPSTLDAHQVLFKELIVTHCLEWGECRWKVKYALGYNTGFPHTLVTDSASSGEQILIHESRSFDSFPTKLFLYVYEYDGGIGAEWEWVGSGEYDLTGPGSFSARFENDEGHVTLTFDVAATGIVAGGTESIVNALDYVQKSQSRHIAIFEKGGGGHQYISGGDQAGAEWAYFVQQRGSLKAQGMRLVDFEIYQTPRGPRYAGVYRESSDNAVLVAGSDGAGVDWGTFLSTWQTQANSGYRLVDLEVHSFQGQQLFSGLFHEGSVAYGWNVNDWDGFVEGHQSLVADGLRLIDIETYLVGATQVFAGVYAEGDETNELWIGDWRTFVRLWEERAEARLPLIDVETYISGDQRYYVGVFKTGGPATHALVAGQDWSQFVAKWQSYSAEGYRLVDVERYVGLHGPASDRRWVHSELTARVPLPLRRPSTRFAVGPGLLRPVALPSTPDVQPTFRRGEVNGDGAVDLSDVLALLNWSFDKADASKAPAELSCEDAADTNDDGAVDLSDAVTQLNALFLGGEALPAPGSDHCGVDPTDDSLGCKTSSCEEEVSAPTEGPETHFPVRTFPPSLFEAVRVEIPRATRPLPRDRLLFK